MTFYSNSLKKKKGKKDILPILTNKREKNEIVPFLSQHEFYQVPPAKCFITHKEPPCLLLFVKERYRISKSTHIYFIQIYIEVKYYISVRSFDTNQENPTIF